MPVGIYTFKRRSAAVDNYFIYFVRDVFLYLPLTQKRISVRIKPKLWNYYMPVLFLVIRIQSACRKAILICLISIVAGVSNCDRYYHVYGGITFFEGSDPKNEVKRRP